MARPLRCGKMMEADMVYRLVIQDMLPGTNEYSKAQRGGIYKGSKMKSETEEYIGWHIRAQMHGLKITQPVRLLYIWCEKSAKRDYDNIRQGEKFIQDALVKMGVLKGDGPKYICGSYSEYTVDADKPRIEVYIVEQMA